MYNSRYYISFSGRSIGIRASISKEKLQILSMSPFFFLLFMISSPDHTLLRVSLSISVGAQVS
jgi:hypothetical protein